MEGVQPAEHLFTAIDPTSASRVLELAALTPRIERPRPSDIPPALDLWLTVAAGTRVVEIPIGVISSSDGRPQTRIVETLSIDLQQLKVPSWIWR